MYVPAFAIPRDHFNIARKLKTTDINENFATS